MKDPATAPLRCSTHLSAPLGEPQPLGGSDRRRDSAGDPGAAARGQSGCAAGAAPMPGSQLRRPRLAKVEEGLRGSGQRGGRARHPPLFTWTHPGAAAAPVSPSAGAAAGWGGAPATGGGWRVRRAGCAVSRCARRSAPAPGGAGTSSLPASPALTAPPSTHRPAPAHALHALRPSGRASAPGSLSAHPGLSLSAQPGLSWAPCPGWWRTGDLRRPFLFLHNTRDSPKLLHTEELQCWGSARGWG